MPLKYSKDRKAIPEHVYYYLLNWAENDGYITIEDLFKTRKLAELNRDQIVELFVAATHFDIITMNTEKP